MWSLVYAMIIHRISNYSLFYLKQSSFIFASILDNNAFIQSKIFKNICNICNYAFQAMKIRLFVDGCRWKVSTII